MGFCLERRGVWVSVWFLSAFDCGWDFGSPFPLIVCMCVLTVPDDFRMSKYPGGPSSSSGGNGIVPASPSATTVVAIRSKRILLLSGF